MNAFIQMYDSHSAREDTVIFPAFHQLVPPDVYNALGEKFEEIEEEKFGENGFENILAQVEEIEKALGIYNLDQYTIQCKS